LVGEFQGGQLENKREEGPLKGVTDKEGLRERA